jgi:hypothetical protein
MMHQYARLAEQRVHAVVGFYVSQHPDTVHTPVESLLKAFKDGINEDGLLDSHMPDLSAVMSRIPNTRETWLSERLGIETLSRDLGDPNLFLTLNMDTRAWPDVRRLLHRLEHGEDSAMDPDYFEVSTDKYTELLDKYAVQVSIYLHMKVKLFLRIPGRHLRSAEKRRGWRLERARSHENWLVLGSCGVHRGSTCNTGTAWRSFRTSSTQRCLEE